MSATRVEVHEVQGFQLIGRLLQCNILSHFCSKSNGHIETKTFVHQNVIWPNVY
jgi:hypothetical protein